MDSTLLEPPVNGANTIRGILDLQAANRPDAPAILGLQGPPMTYARLSALADESCQRLRTVGIAPSDRVAVVLPDGPEMAAAFLSIVACAACAPLNPAYRAEDFDFYLADLGAKALVVKTDQATPAREVARRRGIPVLELSPEDGAAGMFRLGSGAARGHAAIQPVRQPGTQDVALVLHTSGTTSRPKIVPLTQLNLCRSAFNVARSLELAGTDLCLNIMPLFHVHGLIGALLSSMVAGGGIVCTPGFLAPHFLEWMRAFDPTWFTAVPTMHQAILGRALADPGKIPRQRLRFIRSCSAALPPTVMADLERVFERPVIEAYGMTEAAHQMASNPLPPRLRKPGSVGVAAGPEVAILDELGKLLPPGETGEVAIRGDNVTAGYEGNAEATRAAFAAGWFRTGDQGRLDADGYLFLTGRLKELINRGGEKIGPREIDEALLAHPDVAQAVAFPIPDPRLGEEIGAAIVLRPGARASEEELQRFLSRRLPDFKVPRRIVPLPEIPKGPTGKIQRIGLAGRLGISLEPAPAQAPYAAPRDATELALTQTAQEVLRLPRVGIDDPFFQIGGDSVLATQFVSRVNARYGVELMVASLFQKPTIRQFAEALKEELSRDQSGVSDESLRVAIDQMSEEEALRLLADVQSKSEPTSPDKP